MVVPGFLETGQKERGSSLRSEWRTPFRFFVEKMGRENVNIGLIRLFASLLWALVLYKPLYSDFGLQQLRQVLMLHHTMAAMGLDEGLLMSKTAQEAFLVRLLVPGKVATPFLRDLLPKRQSFVGVAAYAAFLLVGAFQVATRSVSNAAVSVFTGLFLLCVLFDRGVFHSTRPSDIFKFLAATLLSRPERNVYVLLACLYFWSGLVKLRGFFHRFVFPYQFLNFSGVSWFFKGLLFDEAYLPRGIVSFFGAFGTFLEMAAGLGMLAAPAEWTFWFMYMGCTMHVFIFFFGMGPFRWNIMTLYMLVCCISFQREAPLRFWPGALDSGDVVAFFYLFVFGFAIPVIGLVQPITLGHYFGGYRMATFHFAGNDAYRALLIRRDAVPPAPAAGAAEGVYAALLRERAAKCERLTEDEDLWTGILYSDGADIEGSLRRGFAAPSGMASFEDFDRSYVYVPVTWLNMRGPLLNTKWDEYLPVTDRIVELCVESVGKRGEDGEVRLPEGAVLLHVQHAVPWVQGRRKRAELLDLTASQWSQRRYVEEVPLPWLWSSLQKLAAGEHEPASNVRPLLRDG